MFEGALSPWHVAILVAVVLFVFGPSRLPELGSALGRTITGFKQGLREGLEEEVTAEPSVSQPVAPGPVSTASTESPDADPAVTPPV